MSDRTACRDAGRIADVDAAAPRAARWSWRRLLITVYIYGLAWMVSLAAVDGVDGLGHILETDYE